MEHQKNQVQNVFDQQSTAQGLLIAAKNLVGRKDSDPSPRSNQSSSQMPQGLNLQTLRKQTLFTYQKVSEALKECTLINRQIDDTIVGADSSYQKLQRIDLELQGQLQIIRMLVVQLENKKLDVQLLFDKVLLASQCQQNLQNILAQLSKSQVNQSIIKHSSISEESHDQRRKQSESSGIGAEKSSQNQNSNSSSCMMENLHNLNPSCGTQHPQESQDRTGRNEQSEINNKTGQFPLIQSKIQTLCDFVDEDSITEITSKAELAFASLKSLKDKTIQMTEQLIKKIDLQISTIHKSKSNLDFQYQIIRDKYSKLKAIIADVHKLFRNVEKIYQTLESAAQSSQGINNSIPQEQMAKIYQALVSIVNQVKSMMEEAHLVHDVFRTCNDSYDEFYENSRESYVNFVNFAPSVQAQMQEVDKWHQQYDIRRQQCLEDFDEIEKLSTWYEFFEKSYAELEKEILRRRNYDQEIAHKVDLMRKFLQMEIEKEQSTRLNFNDQHYRYLPPNLKCMLEDPPTRFDIYPKLSLMGDYQQQDSQYQAPQSLMNPQQMITLLQDWQTQFQTSQGNPESQIPIGQHLLAFSQQQPVRYDKLSSEMGSFVPGSVVDEDYFEKNQQNALVIGNQMMNQSVPQQHNPLIKFAKPVIEIDEDDDNFVSVDDEEFKRPGGGINDKATDKTSKTNTSTKTSEEDKKTV